MYRSSPSLELAELRPKYPPSEPCEPRFSFISEPMGLILRLPVLPVLPTDASSGIEYSASEIGLPLLLLHRHDRAAAGGA